MTPEELLRDRPVLQRMLDRLDSEYDTAIESFSEDYFQVWEEWCAIKSAIDAADTIERLQRENARLDATEAACSNEEAAHRETLRLLEMRDVRIAELEQQVAEASEIIAYLVGFAEEYKETNGVRAREFLKRTDSP